ncbi:MAG: hypothetical protein AAB152_01650 [Candidatus Coatesbacteria bacterium]
MATEREKLGSYGKSLEDAFFLQQDSALIQRHREDLRRQRSAKELSDASGITNAAVLAKLVEMGITAELATSLSIIPLVEVAWADGNVDEKEKAAVLAGAAKCGLAKGRLDYEMLESWLSRRPPAALLEAWAHYVKGLCELLGDGERAGLRKDLLQRARTVAEASGGFLGLTSGISESEKKVLASLESSFC